MIYGYPIFDKDTSVIQWKKWLFFYTMVTNQLAVSLFNTIHRWAINQNVKDKIMKLLEQKRKGLCDLWLDQGDLGKP